MCGSRLALVVLAACSHSDPQACSDRIARFDKRFASLVPDLVTRAANGFDVPRTSRERTRPIGRDGIIAVTRYDTNTSASRDDAGLMTLRGFGRFASFTGTRAQGRPDIDVRAALQSLPASSEAVPLYIIVPEHDHAILRLVDTFAVLDARFDLRLVVGIDGTTSQPAPSDTGDDVRDALALLPAPSASERYSTLQGLLDKAGAGCEGLAKAVAATIVDGRPAMPALVDTIRRCGCQTVDVPAVEAIVAAASFAIGQPELGWMPLDVSVTTGTAQQFATAVSHAPAPEPGLGAPCRTAADCTLIDAACVPFDRDGTWFPGEPSHCTRPCGAGCPRGFRCTHEARITGVNEHGIQGEVVGQWCGPIAPRTN